MLLLSNIVSLGPTAIVTTITKEGLVPSRGSKSGLMFNNLDAIVSYVLVARRSGGFTKEEQARRDFFPFSSFSFFFATIPLWEPAVTLDLIKLSVFGGFDLRPSPSLACPGAEENLGQRHEHRTILVTRPAEK